MNKNLKIALEHRSSEQGFALPIALGMGLITILIAATMIARSQDDRVIASAQKETNRALSAAEVGVTRYQALLNNNREFATYPRIGTPGWTTASSIPKTRICANSDASQVTAAATTNWQNVDSSDSSKGQYKLSEYTYVPTNLTQGRFPGTGTLTVEGRVNQPVTSTSKLVVNIPVASQPLNCKTAGLWLQNVSQNMGSNQIKGDILITANSSPAGVSSSNLQNQTTQKLITNPNVPFPDTPEKPTSDLNLISAADMNSRIWGQTLPKTGDLPQPDGSYHYLIQGALSKSGNANITLATNTKVVLYVQENINIGGSPAPVINQNRYPQNLHIYSNTFRRNSNGTIQLDASNRPLTKYGCSSILPVISPGFADPPADYSGACPTTSVSVNGGGAIQAFIHAPDATGNVSGSGGLCNTSANPPTGGGYIGAVWIKKWDRLSNNNAGPMVCAYGNYSDYTRQLSQPSIPPISSWERQVVTP